MKTQVRVYAGIVFLSALVLAAGCYEKKRAGNSATSKAVAGKEVAAAKAKENPGRVRDIKSKCEATPEEGKEAIAKVRDWVPVVNENKGDKPLRDVVTGYVEQGIYELCWSASKKSNGNWKVTYNYIDISGSFQEAEWDYNPQNGQIQPFSQNAFTFWTGSTGSA